MKKVFLLGFSLFLLMMSWEGQLTSANVLDNGPIPHESIRLRIIANSDSVQDQWLKREVRDALIEQMNSWTDQIQTYEEAQQFIPAHLPQLQQVVDQTIRERGFSYKAVVDFGEVPFPTKMYGTYVYPAGDYQALRVRIGEAQGQNWWCVLFPPLCFIDMTHADATAAELPTVKPTSEKPGNTLTSYRDNWMNERLYAPEREEADDENTEPLSEEKEEQKEVAVESAEVLLEAQPEVQVKFFLWEKLEKLFM